MSDERLGNIFNFSIGRQQPSNLEKHKPCVIGESREAQGFFNFMNEKKIKTNGHKGAAVAYKAHLAKHPPVDEIHDVTMPSGFVWKLRKFPIAQWTLAGKVPNFFTSKTAMSMISAGTINEKSFGKNVNADDVNEMLDFMREVALYSAVSPRISLEPTSDDEIAPEDISKDDFNALIKWTMAPSGGEAQGLGKFRG